MWHHHFLRFSFCLMIGLTVPAQNAHAASNPPALQGIWSSPDCTTANQIRILSKHFMIQTAGRRLLIGETGEWQHNHVDGEDFYSLKSEFFNPLLLNRTNDGLMKTITVSANDTRNQNQIWDQTPPAQMTEYSHCAKLFDSHPALNQAEVNSIFLLDWIKDGCAAVRPEKFSYATNCQQILFNTLDTDQSGALGQDELAAIYQQTAFLQTGLGICVGGAAYPGDSVRQGQAFAEGLLQANDHRELQRADIHGLFRASSPALQPFLEAVGTLKPLLDFIPSDGSVPAAKQTACPANNIGPNKTGAIPVVEGPLNIQWQTPRYGDQSIPAGD